MTIDNSIWSYFYDAGIVVKLVILILVFASIASWTIIFQRTRLLKNARKALTAFEDMFWSGIDLTKLYSQINAQERDAHDQEAGGLKSIFVSGFKEFLRLNKQPSLTIESVVEGAQRSMRIANARETDRLERHLSLLATIGSTSPYIGLFGTVWGIMTSFHALGNVQQATIAMVAPGISEALIATAMGLFAAIPAVIAYNRFVNEVDRLLSHFETFQEEFSAIMYRQIATGQVE